VQDSGDEGDRDNIVVKPKAAKKAKKGRAQSEEPKKGGRKNAKGAVKG
jgi:hypothetical protein